MYDGEEKSEKQLSNGILELISPSLTLSFSFFFFSSCMSLPSAGPARCSFDFARHYESAMPKVPPLIPDGFPHNVSDLGMSERARQGGKRVTLRAGKTDYSDCRRVRLAGSGPLHHFDNGESRS